MVLCRQWSLPTSTPSTVGRTLFDSRRNVRRVIVVPGVSSRALHSVPFVFNRLVVVVMVCRPGARLMVSKDAVPCLIVSRMLAVAQLSVLLTNRQPGIIVVNRFRTLFVVRRTPHRRLSRSCVLAVSSSAGSPLSDRSIAVLSIAVELLVITELSSAGDSLMVQAEFGLKIMLLVIRKALTEPFGVMALLSPVASVLTWLPLLRTLSLPMAIVEVSELPTVRCFRPISAGLSQAPVLASMRALTFRPARLLRLETLPC